MTIIGRVTRDAEVRSLSNNKQVVNFSVAVNHSYKAKNGDKVTQTEFFDCAYWFATGIAQYLTKGSIVELTGRVSARAWMGSNGEPKAGLNFNTNEITLHGSNGKAVSDAHAQQTHAQQGDDAAPASVRETKVYDAEVLPNGAAIEDDLPF